VTLADLRSSLLEARDEAAALEWLHEQRCTDGLPVVIPTPERVERMVLASGLDADISLGAVGPNLGEATVEKVAVNAVMAGCLPDHFPVVVAAIRAVCDPVLDMTEVQSTTHNVAPLVIVSGPARAACGVSGGWGALGYGHRANASIGRAVRLCLVNLGGGWPGVSDMALLGHPGKFTYCLAEDEEVSPFPPLVDHSAVTVVCVEAPHSVIGSLDVDDPTSSERMLATLGATIASSGTNNAHSGAGAVVVVLNPDHASVLARQGHDRESIKAGIVRHAVNRHLAEVAPPGRRVDPEAAALRSPDQIVLLVAGGNGLYSSVMPSWGGGTHRNTWITHPIDLDQACMLPPR
jgi:hypothetical protein